LLTARSTSRATKLEPFELLDRTSTNALALSMPLMNLDAHLASPHIDAFLAVASDLLAEPANITLWSEIED
jgi:hypothetical protein